MKNRFFSFAALLILSSILLYSCSKDDTKVVQPPEQAPYSNGFFILNEGWFGHELGSVNFYGYGQDSLITQAYAKENNGEAPSKEGATLENGVIINGRLYLISKAGGPIAVADAGTLKNVGTIEMAGGDFRSMVALTDKEAVVSSDKGILSVDLDGLQVDPTPIAGGGPVKDLLYTEMRLFASAHGGIDIYDPSSWKLLKHYEGPTEGCVRALGKTVYGGADKLLVAIDPATMDTTQIHLTAAISRNDFGYNKSSIVASNIDNVLYYIAASADYMPRNIYKYDKANPASLTRPFITLPAGEQFYQTGIAYDQAKHMIVTCSITGYSETDKNYLRFYDAKTGVLKQTITYDHPYFPAVIVFHPLVVLPV